MILDAILGNENKKRPKRKTEMQRLKRIDREKDDDIKRKLRMGDTVEIREIVDEHREEQFKTYAHPDQMYN